jgi:hypothetical protein
MAEFQPQEILSTKALAVIPPIAWDWPKMDALVSPEQYNFADFMPVSPETAEVLTRSSSKFSSNYKSFIEVLDPAAPPSSVITQAMDAYNNLDYRTWVLYPTRPVSKEPSYDIQNYQDWLDGMTPQVAPEADRTVTWQGMPPPQSEPGLLASSDENGWTETTLSDALQQLSTTAQAWGRIPISPAPWFDSGFVGIKANGPYLTGYSRCQQGNAVYFFGPGGLLYSRVSELIVAYKPTVTLTVNGQLSPIDSQRVSSALEVRIGSIQCKGSETSVSTDNAGNTVVSGTPASETPFIVGVTVEFYE